MSKVREVTVLGGGNGAYIAAAHLALKGFSVRLCEVPEFAAGIKEAMDTGLIKLDVRGNPGITPGIAKLSKVTTDPKEAVEGADVILMVIPAFAQDRFTEFVGPYLAPGQIVVLMPGNFGGSFEMQTRLSKAGYGRGVTFAEVECMIYSGFKEGTGAVWVSGYKKGLTFSCFPGNRTSEALEKCREMYPELIAGTSILETGLSNINTIVHAPILVLNAGWAEKTKGSFLFYWDGCTESVGHVVEGVEAERQAIGDALGMSLRPARKILLDWYGHQGAHGETLGEVLRTNPVYEWDTAPGNLKHRFLLEDIPYGMVPVETLGEILGVKTSTISSIITLSCGLTGIDLRQNARDLRKLGLADMSVERIVDFMNRGV